jgi:hypothetical protein
MKSLHSVLVGLIFTITVATARLNKGFVNPLRATEEASSKTETKTNELGQSVNNSLFASTLPSFLSSSSLSSSTKKKLVDFNYFKYFQKEISPRHANEFKPFDNRRKEGKVMKLL